MNVLRACVLTAVVTTALSLGASIALFGEDHLPLVEPQTYQRAIVIEVEEFLARAGRLAGEQVGQVVAVEMYLEGLVANLHAFEQLLLHIRHADSGQERGEHVLV